MPDRRSRSEGPRDRDHRKLQGPIANVASTPEFAGKNLHDKNSRDCQVDLLLLESQSDHPPTRLAEINGSGHKIVIRSRTNAPPSRYPPIVFGESFWADVHAFRAPETKRHDWTGARGIELRNDTVVPIIFSPTARDCVVFTRGAVVENSGTNIEVRKLPAITATGVQPEDR